MGHKTKIGYGLMSFGLAGILASFGGVILQERETVKSPPAANIAPIIKRTLESEDLSQSDRTNYETAYKALNKVSGVEEANRRANNKEDDHWIIYTAMGISATASIAGTFLLEDPRQADS